MCEEEDGHISYHPDKANCAMYYMCEGERRHHMPCPVKLVFNPSQNVCDWPENVVGCENTFGGAARWKIFPFFLSFLFFSFLFFTQTQPVPTFFLLFFFSNFYIQFDLIWISRYLSVVLYNVFDVREHIVSIVDHVHWSIYIFLFHLEFFLEFKREKKKQEKLSSILKFDRCLAIFALT